MDSPNGPLIATLPGHAPGGRLNRADLQRELGPSPDRATAGHRAEIVICDEPTTGEEKV